MTTTEITRPSDQRVSTADWLDGLVTKLEQGFQPTEGDIYTLRNIAAEVRAAKLP